MQYFNYNGKIHPASAHIIGPDNRGLRYGDGLFETLKYRNGQFILLDEHFARLWKGMQLLQMDIPKLLSPDVLQKQLVELMAKNKLAAARVRISVIRGDGGLYNGKNTANYILQCTALPENAGQWNMNGLHTGIFPDAKKMADHFANCKHNNFLPYVMGALYAKNKKWNDAIILNNAGNICDTTIANIFMIKDDIIITPSLAEGCVAGIMRKQLIQSLVEERHMVQETTVTIEDLMQADEVFLTNSIYNMRWISSIDDKVYTGEKSRNLYERLVATNATIFC